MGAFAYLKKFIRLSTRVPEEIPMSYYPPYGSGAPFYNPMPYQAAAEEEKRQIRRLTNQLSWVSLLCIFLMSAFAVGLELLLRSVGYSFDMQWSQFGGIDPVLYYMINGVAYVVGLALPVLLYFIIRRIPLSVGLPFSKARPSVILACAFLGCAVCLLANIPANLIANLEKVFGFSGSIPDMPLNNNIWVLILYFINIVVIPPIVEEMVFRGLLLQGLRRFGDGFAIIASAIFFGLYHANFVQTVFAVFCGIIMGLVVVRTHSLLPSILIHFMNNGISFALEMVQRSQGDEAAGRLNGIITIAFIALGLLSMVYLLIREKGFFHVQDTPSPLRLSSKLGALFTNPGTIVMCLYALVTSIYVLVHY
jgi:uncharacterized protein